RLRTGQGCRNLSLSRSTTMRTKMQMNQWVVTAAILSVYGAVGQLIADETADTVKDLKQQNELLNQRVKALEEQLNQKIKALEDDWEIGFRLASAPSVGANSGGDPLSTNQTFEDNGSRKPVGVDWVFARWTPIHTPKWTGSFALGKLENPPNYTEDIFDVDY